MRIKKFAARVLIAAVGGAGLIVGFGVTGGEAHAATSCHVANGHEQQHIVGHSGCGARAGAGATANADETSGAGTAVAVSDNGGHANARNMQPGSAAMAGANSGGTAYSVTTGPKATSMAQAHDGGTSIAVGGWGGEAIVTPYGVGCGGGFGAAVDTATGKACLKSGVIDLRR